MQGTNKPLSCCSSLCRFVRKITADIIFINVYYVNNVWHKSIQADDLTWFCMRHERGVLVPCITYYCPGDYQCKNCCGILVILQI